MCAEHVDVIRGEMVLAENGTRTEAHFIRKYVAASLDGGGERYVDYWFELPTGERIYASHTVPAQTWRALNEGAAMEVIYASESPAKNFPQESGALSRALTWFIGCLGAIFFVSGLALVAEIWSDLGRLRKSHWHAG